MRAYNTLLLLVLSLFTFFSCSKDNVDEFIDLHGVWDNVQIEGNEIHTIRLIFGENNVGAEIRKRGLDTNETEGSSISSFDWNIQKDVIQIINDGATEQTYFINSEGQLVSNASSGLVFDKVSNDYSQYK